MKRGNVDILLLLPTRCCQLVFQKQLRKDQDSRQVKSNELLKHLLSKNQFATYDGFVFFHDLKVCTALFDSCVLESLQRSNVAMND